MTASAIDWEEQERAAWRLWSDAPTLQARHALVHHYGAWLRSIARETYLSFRVHGTELNDYIQFATQGMLEALDRFDPTLGVPFRAYARPRVRGAILNGIPKFSESSHHFTSTKNRWNERIISLCEHDEEEQLLGDTLEEIADLTITLALGYLLEDSALFEAPQGSQYGAELLVVMQKSLLCSLDKLTALEASVIRFHYFNQIAFKDVAKLLSLSAARISQLHKAALKKLKLILDGGSELDIGL